MIPRRWLVVILFFTLLEPFHYFLLVAFPLQGRHFMAYDADEGLVLGLMRTADKGFENPWSTNGEKIFNNPALTSPYPYIMLGFIRDAFMVDPFVLNVVAKAVLTFVLLVVAFLLINELLRGRKKSHLAFVFFLMPFGIQPVMTFVSVFSGIDFLGAGFSHEFLFLNSFSRVYYYLPFISALASFLMFLRQRKLFSSLLLGVALLLHPGFGLAAFIMTGLHAFCSNYRNSFREALFTSYKDVRILGFAVVFLIPWFISYISSQGLFALYKQNNLIWRAHLFSIVGSYFILLSIIFIAKRQELLKRKKFLAGGLVFSLLFIAAELSSLGVPFFSSLRLPFASVVEVLLLAFFLVAAYFVIKSRLDPLEKFLASLVLVLVPVSIVNPAWVLWAPYRFPFFMRIPLAILAALYFPFFLSKMQLFGLKKKIVVALIIVLSLSSFMVYNYRFQESPRREPHTYYASSQYAAMKFLDGLPQGIVLDRKSVV